MAQSLVLRPAAGAAGEELLPAPRAVGLRTGLNKTLTKHNLVLLRFYEAVLSGFMLSNLIPMTKVPYHPLEDRFSEGYEYLHDSCTTSVMRLRGYIQISVKRSPDCAAFQISYDAAGGQMKLTRLCD